MQLNLYWLAKNQVLIFNDAILDKKYPENIPGIIPPRD
jgi:hypothetical protein